MNTATATAPALDSFARAYLECALWSSTDNSTEQGGEPLDRNFSISDLAPEALASALEDCADFQAANAELLEQAEIDTARAGFLFWLNRNGHGSGFWDEYGPADSRRIPADALSKASKVYGTVDLYPHEGQIYSS